MAELTESSCVPVGQLEHVDGTNRCFQGPAQSDNQSRHQHFNVSKVSVASHSIDAKTAPVVSGSCRLKRKQQSNHCSIEKMMVSGEAITSRHVNAKGHPLKHLKPRQATALPGKENVDPGFRISLSSSSAKARTEESGLLAESVRESLATRWVAEEAHITEECGTGNCNTTNAKAGNVTQDVGESRLSSSVPISDIIPPSMTSANTKRNSCQSDLYSKGMIKARKQVEVKKPTDHRADVSAPPGQQIPMLVENQAADQSFCPKVQVSTLSIQAEECPSVPVARAVPADTEGPLAISASARPADLTNTMLRPLDSVPLVQLVRDDEEIWKEWEGIRLLGEGVYGRVYLVRNRSTQEERAFKRMYLHVRRRSEASEKPVQELAENSSTAAIMAAAGGGTLPAVVQREVTVLRALRGQPNVIPLHGVLIGSHRVYLSFPLVKGGTLSDLLRCFAGWAENLRCNTGKKRQQGSGGPNRPQATPQFPSAGTCLCEALREASQLGAYSGGSGMAGEQRSSAITRASSNVSPEGTHTHSGDSWTSPVSQYTPTNGEINANGEKTRPSQCTELACACPCRRCIPQCGLPLGLCLRVAHALLRGIAACHEKRIVHRDLKPDNVLVQWTEVPMDQTRCRRTLEYMAAVGSVKEGSPTADVLEKRGGPNHIQTSSAKNLVVVAAASAKEPADYVTSLDTSKSTENSQDDDCLLPPPLVQRLYIADFGLARTLPFFTSPYFPKDANSPEVVSSQQLPTPETHDVAGQDTPEMRRTDALVGSPLRNSKQTPSIDDGDGTSGVCLSPEIITLNYRPLEVLLGSSSYTLAVDIWSVGYVQLVSKVFTVLYMR